MELTAKYRYRPQGSARVGSNSMSDFTVINRNDRLIDPILNARTNQAGEYIPRLARHLVPQHLCSRGIAASVGELLDKL